MDELALLDATAQAELVRARKVSPRELVDAAIGRIERLNPELGAVVTPTFESARAAADGPLPDGPFTGVPFLHKDIIAAVAGVPLTEGSRLLAGYVPAQDSELVRRHRAAGLVLLGKTATSEFGLMPTAESALFGAPKNPWDPTRTTGGSSGGSAAAVAAGLVPMAHANDGGGSIRIPASCCGVFGLKPTRGRNPLGSVMAGAVTMGSVVEHAVTRSVRDSAILLDATRGRADGDPYDAPAPRRPYREELGVDPGKLRIAVAVRAPNGAPVHADCLAAVNDVAKLLAGLGHHVEEAEPPLDGAALAHAFLQLFTSGAAADVEHAGRLAGRTPTQDDFEPATWAMAQLGRGLTAPGFLHVLEICQRMSLTMARFMEAHDVVLTPTVAGPPPPLGSFASTLADPMSPIWRAGAFIPFTPLMNVTGQPAMSMPLVWNEGGLPIGVQFIGRLGDESTLFRLASQLEQARPWAGRRPPVAA